MSKRFLCPLLGLLCVFSLLIQPHADDLDSVRLEGAVLDSDGKPLPGARIFVRRAENNAERVLLADAEGRYLLTMLSPGTYSLRVETNGFQIMRVENLTAIAGATIRRNFHLSPAAIEAQITIDGESEAGLVDPSRTVVGGTVTKRQIDELPVESRNPLDLIFTLPGVAPPALSERDLADGEAKDNFRRAPEESGVFALNGGTPFSNNITIEGLDNNDDRAARERFLPSLHAVEEVQVITNQFSAEYGRASGGRVNLRLRGGANDLHGHAFYFFRDEALNANSFTRNADPARGFRIPFQNHNPGGSLGGPIIKQKAFFFAAYEFNTTLDSADIAALLPVDANPAFPLPLPNGANLGMHGKNSQGFSLTLNGGKAVGLFDQRISTPGYGHIFQSRNDFKLNEKHDSFALLTYTFNRDERGFPGGRRTLDTLRRTGRDSYSIAFGDTTVLGPRWINGARFQFSRLLPADAPPTNNPVVLIDIDDPRDVPGDPNANPLSRAGNLLAGSSNIGGTDRREDRIQAQDTMNFLLSSHSLRFGFDYQRIHSEFVDLADTTGTFTFASVADFLANKFSRYVHRFKTGSAQTNSYAGIFIQDDWRLRPNLTISAGLRWDNETILKDRNNVGPRVSLAWDPFKKSSSVLRAGYGIFYNRALLRTIDDFRLTSRKLLVDTNNEAARTLLGSISFPTVLAAGDPRIAQLGIKESGFLRRLEAGFRIPESYQASVGFDHELRRGLKLEVNYVFNRGLHLWREVNANAPILPAGFADFTAYLLSRDFDNRRDPATNARPITATGRADTVRFSTSAMPSTCLPNPNCNGANTVVTFGLNNPSVSNAAGSLVAAQRAIRSLRPDPSVTQVEELQARGNSFYHGLSMELSSRIAKNGFVRGSYTLGSLRDDGVVNTSSPVVPGDFARERSRSLLDARHRIALSGSYRMPRILGGISFAGTFNFASSLPFNIGNSGNDRNLDDVSNDRPNFTGDLAAIHWRRSGAALDAGLFNAFSLPTIGSAGNLPRNAGRGPASSTMNLRLSRRFAITERHRAEFLIEAFNPLNATVFAFGAEFVDYAPTAAGTFLIPRRTVRPRTLRVGLKYDF